MQCFALGSRHQSKMYFVCGFTNLSHFFQKWNTQGPLLAQELCSIIGFVPTHPSRSNFPNPFIVMFVKDSNPWAITRIPLVFDSPTTRPAQYFFRIGFPPASSFNLALFDFVMLSSRRTKYKILVKLFWVDLILARNSSLSYGGEHLKLCLSCVSSYETTCLKLLLYDLFGLFMSFLGIKKLYQLANNLFKEFCFCWDTEKEKFRKRQFQWELVHNESSVLPAAPRVTQDAIPGSMKVLWT